MKLNRHEFMRRLGVTLAGWLAARTTAACQVFPPRVLCYDQAPPDTPTPAVTCYTVMPSPTPSLSSDAGDYLTRQAQIFQATLEAGGLPAEATRQAQAALARERLRLCWLAGLDALAKQAEDLDVGEQAQKQLLADHRAALNDLVALNELSAEAADQAQIAFEGAAYHVWRSNAPITCYEPMLVDFRPVSSGDLVSRAKILSMSSDLNPNTLAVIQASMERDVAFLNMSPDEVNVLYQRFIQSRKQGQPPPDFAHVELEVPPEAAEAAQFLIEVLARDRLRNRP